MGLADNLHAPRALGTRDAGGNSESRIKRAKGRARPALYSTGRLLGVASRHPVLRDEIQVVELGERWSRSSPTSQYVFQYVAELSQALQ